MNLFMRYLYLIVLLIVSFSTEAQTTAYFAEQTMFGTSKWLDSTLQNLLPEYRAIWQNPKRFKIQIIYTQIDRDEDQTPHLRHYSYQVDTGSYFYPASTVKLPACALALEYIKNLETLGVNKFTEVQHIAQGTCQTSATIDTTTLSYKPSIANYIKKILLVSDNEAYDRLYELLGQQKLNESLWAKGFLSARLLHRLYHLCSTEQNRETNAVIFKQGDSTLCYQPRQKNPNIFRNRFKDFPVSTINPKTKVTSVRTYPVEYHTSISLPDLHKILIAIMLPNCMPDSQRFQISEDDYDFLRKYMGMYPKESLFPNYQDSLRYPSGFMKYFLYGGITSQVDSNVRSFNKVGIAWGFATDVAYIADFNHNVEFMLSATIFADSDGDLNDGNNELYLLALPFLKRLSEVLLLLEQKRFRLHPPDLEPLKSYFK